MSVLKECGGFILSRHIVVKIHCNRTVGFNIKKIQQTVTTWLKIYFFMLKKKKSTALVEQADEEKFLDGDRNCQLKSLAC